jgi:hypothetical protein
MKCKIFWTGKKEMSYVACNAKEKQFTVMLDTKHLKYPGMGLWLFL